MSLGGECLKHKLSFYCFTVKDHLLSHHVQNIKQIDRIVYLLPALKIWSYVVIISDILYREKSVFKFNLMSKKLQRYDFPLIFSDRKITYVNILPN